MTPVAAVLEFLRCINHHDADQLAGMMTEDHLFVDPLGRKVQGREAMREAWRNYYMMCPDYWVVHELVLADGNTVAVFGEAGGTIADGSELPEANRWRIPAAWRAVTETGLIREWRVFADNQPVYRIIAAMKQSAR